MLLLLHWNSFFSTSKSFLQCFTKHAAFTRILVHVTYFLKCASIGVWQVPKYTSVVLQVCPSVLDNGTFKYYNITMPILSQSCLLPGFLMQTRINKKWGTTYLLFKTSIELFLFTRTIFLKNKLQKRFFYS